MMCNNNYAVQEFRFMKYHFLNVTVAGSKMGRQDSIKVSHSKKCYLLWQPELLRGRSLKGPWQQKHRSPLIFSLD